ncbi:hypothetical protein GCM10007938_17820 [Vibrio zhanjiangensis]|uniref:Twin-arginine translocation pathway signal n=1 Tax=Vibrio zhanjiangensis TaxID=1046128 RepID=A0ABQ6EYX2_9VIBR|nr:hypothetical protein [Vibrio zhanjiangensis]GLT18004.1 hypothetical protein GCM10007938_17820 [Vibrio zhanjiangensis]
MYKKIPYQSSTQIVPRFQASDEAQKLLSEELPIDHAIVCLQEAELYNDLVQFLAHALPVRECIWWALCCLSSRNDVWSDAQKMSLDTAKHWALSPSEELRRKSELLANRLELNCGPSWLSQAVFWNGSGSIVAPDLPVVLPDPYLYAKAVAGAINHAAALPFWDKTAIYYEDAIKAALDIAQGGNGGIE